MEITLTGIDEQTRDGDIRWFHAAGVEMGILYTETPEGRNRYPSVDWMASITRRVSGRYALHVCGRRARHVVISGEPGKALRSVLDSVQRIQLNGVLPPEDVVKACQRYPEHTIITQSHPENALDVGCDNHAVLVDASGGRGKSPTEWIRPSTSRAVGFAGGLGPHNLDRELPRILAVAKEPTWIDMEGRLRDSQDWFSVAAARSVVEAVTRSHITAVVASFPWRIED